MPTNEQKIALEKLRGCIHAAQNFVDKSISAHHLDVLFLIALNEGITRTEISDALDTTIKSTNRYVGDLTQYAYDRDKKTSAKKIGFNLIHEVNDPKDSKIKHLYLTDKGCEFCEMLANRVLYEQKEQQLR